MMLRLAEFFHARARAFTKTLQLTPSSSRDIQKNRRHEATIRKYSWPGSARQKNLLPQSARGLSREFNLTGSGRRTNSIFHAASPTFY
jgi:hypothetical protein